MADLIDRQAVLEIAMQYCPDDDGSCSKADMDVRDLLDEIENLPVMNDWISCSEKLPESESIVFVYYKEIGMAYTGSMFDDKSGWNIDCGSEAERYCDFDKITHWMPIHEPPEGSVENA